MTATTNANTASLDMSLDDLIKSNKSMRRERRRGGRGNGERGRGGYPGVYGGGVGGGPGPFRNRHMNRAMTYRANPYGAAVPPKFARQPASDGVWQHDMFAKVTEILPPFGRPMGIETGTKLYISNLEYGVSTDDIKELFSEVGDLKRCSIHYDPSGRSKGTAEVVYCRKIDGIAALKRYNNVQLDGKSMKIEFIGSNLVTPAVPSTTATMATMAAAQSASTLRVINGVSNRFYQGHEVMGLPYQAPNRSFGMGSGNRGRRFFGGRWSYRGRGRGGRGGRGRGRGPRGGRGGPGRMSTMVNKSAADLDAELETYHSEAMQT